MGSRTYRTRQGRRREQEQRRKAILLLLVSVVALIGLIFLCKKLFFETKAQRTMTEINGGMTGLEGGPPLDVQLLTVNEYSRPQIALKKVKGIVIHYTANPGSTAQQNRNYFENLKDEKTTKASSHFVVGLDGEVIQCIPSTEISYASNDRNEDTLSIECCHPDESGKFNDATYQSAVELTAALCRKFDLKSKDVIRHYDITGKDCPKYFVDHEDAWEQFRQDVETKIK